jgi:hypothetical protein
VYLSDPFCPRCKSEEEDLDHILMNCWYAKQAWPLSPLEIRFEGIPMSFMDWLENTISKAHSNVIVYILSLCYGLWYACNKICFEGGNIEAVNIVRKAWNIIEDYKEFMNAHVDVEPTISISSPSTWTLPPTSSFKLNIDASGPVDNTWGVGAIVQDSEGFGLVAATWNFDVLLDVTIVEALAFRLAI